MLPPPPASPGCLCVFVSPFLIYSLLWGPHEPPLAMGPWGQGWTGTGRLCPRAVCPTV